MGKNNIKIETAIFISAELAIYQKKIAIFGNICRKRVKIAVSTLKS